MSRLRSLLVLVLRQQLRQRRHRGRDGARRQRRARLAPAARGALRGRRRQRFVVAQQRRRLVVVRHAGAEAERVGVVALALLAEQRQSGILYEARKCVSARSGV